MCLNKRIIMEQLISIIIPTVFSDVKLLQDCIASVLNQKFDKKLLHYKFELIIVCNTSENKMREIVDDLKIAKNQNNNVKINWICTGSNLGFVGAINTGIKNSKANYMALLNDDAIADSNWLSELVLQQIKTKANMVASKIYLSDKKTLDSQGFGFAWRGKAEALDHNLQCSLSNAKDYWMKNRDLLPKTKFTEPFGPDAAGALYTKELFDKIGLFADDFFAYLEDVELALRARQAGMSCILADKAMVYHHKHLTTKTIGKSFKSKQDMINWWKIVLKRYNFKVWKKFGVLIVVERMRNVSGFMKRIF